VSGAQQTIGVSTSWAAGVRRAARRRPLLIAGAALLVALGAAYLLVLRGGSVEPRVVVPEAVATLGSGQGAVPVAANGRLLERLPEPKQGTLPSLPAAPAPKSGRLGGTMLQQARVLGAAPPALRPHVESSYFGESGVDVILRSGVELRFGDASRAAEKWKAAAAVLADPSITALDYVDLHAPRRPSVAGSGHTLPAFP
jgi:hypothetical protein